ncbi:MAG: hypothetical protein RMY33_025525 [Nostoc sp. DedQUE03]|nr:hypothetical protein [Nostoc sp. DedQUE02]
MKIKIPWLVTITTSTLLFGMLGAAISVQALAVNVKVTQKLAQTVELNLALTQFGLHRLSSFHKRQVQYA